MTIPAIPAVMASGGFSWGWDALVAIGTLLLAGVTFVMVRATRRLARETAADIAGQQRPVIATRPARRSRVEKLPRPCSFEQPSTDGEHPHRLWIRLHNSGPGPALAVRASLRLDGRSPEPWDAGSIPSQAEAWIVFSAVPVPDPEGTLIIDVTYGDLGGRRYESSLTVKRVDNPAVAGRLPDLRVEAVAIRALEARRRWRRAAS